MGVSERTTCHIILYPIRGECMIERLTKSSGWPCAKRLDHPIHAAKWAGFIPSIISCVTPPRRMSIWIGLKLPSWNNTGQIPNLWFSKSAPDWLIPNIQISVFQKQMIWKGYGTALKWSWLVVDVVKPYDTIPNLSSASSGYGALVWTAVFESRRKCFNVGIRGPYNQSWKIELGP